MLCFLFVIISFLNPDPTWSGQDPSSDTVNQSIAEQTIRLAITH